MSCGGSVAEHLLDLAGISLPDDLAPELHRRRELTRLDGEFDGEDAEAFDGLEGGHVAGAEPAVGGERFRSGGRVLVITGEDVRPLEEDFAVLGEPEPGPGKRHADREDAPALR